MRKLLYIVFFVSTIGHSQNKQLLYDFAGLPQTLLLNPGAKVTYQFHIGFPLVSQTAIQVGFTGFPSYSIFEDNGIDINNKIKAALHNFGKFEFFAAYQQLEIVYGGFRLPNNSFLSFGYYQEFDMLAKIPKDMVDLFYDGNTQLNRKYSMKKLAASAEMLGVLHVGLSKRVSDKWQIGARAKLYSSIFNVKSAGNSGKYLIEAAANNMYKHYLSDINLLVQSSGVILEDDVDLDASYFKRNLLFGGSLGLGFDIGFTHQLKKQWELSASLQDIGIVFNTKDIESYKVVGDFVLEGAPLYFDPDNPQDYWTDLEVEFDDEVVSEKLYDNYISIRPVKFNGALSYSFGQTFDDCRFLVDSELYNNKIGFHLFSNVNAVHSYMASTLFYEHRFSTYFSTKITYTVDSYSAKNVGFGLTTQFGAFNFYVLADDLLNLVNLYDAKSASIQLGFNFIFNGKK